MRFKQRFLQKIKTENSNFQFFWKTTIKIIFWLDWKVSSCSVICSGITFHNCCYLTIFFI